ncbi:unnamed protein product [Lota lota]
MLRIHRPGSPGVALGSGGSGNGAKCLVNHRLQRAQITWRETMPVQGQYAYPPPLLSSPPPTRLSTPTESPLFPPPVIQHRVHVLPRGGLSGVWLGVCDVPGWLNHPVEPSGLQPPALPCGTPPPPNSRVRRNPPEIPRDIVGGIEQAAGGMEMDRRAQDLMRLAKALR